jgi:hypothetical protein
MLPRRNTSFDIRDEDLLDEELAGRPDVDVGSDDGAVTKGRRMPRPSGRFITWAAVGVTAAALAIVAAGLASPNGTPQARGRALMADARFGSHRNPRAEASRARVVTAAYMAATGRSRGGHAAGPRPRHRSPRRSSQSTRRARRAQPHPRRAPPRPTPAPSRETPAPATAAHTPPAPTSPPASPPVRTSPPSPEHTSTPVRPATRSSSDEFGIER